MFDLKRNRTNKKGRNYMSKIPTNRMRIMKGDKYIECMKNYFSLKNTNSYIDFSHISYNKIANSIHDNILVKEVSHDGTLFFEIEAMAHIFTTLVNHNVLSPTSNTINNSVKYVIGDLLIKESAVYKGKKGFPVFNQYFELPIKVIEEE